MYISNTAASLEPQLVRNIYEQAKQYNDVIDLTLGDPDIPTPAPVSEAGCRAIMEGKTKYTANAGIPALREAIARDVFKRTGVQYDPASEIVVTAGAMGALYLSSMCLLDDGDEMIVLEPHWPNYSNMVKMCHAAPRFVNCLGDENIANLKANIEALICPATRAIIMNSPSNPTGRVLGFESIKQIAEIAEKYNLYVVSDEVYHSIVFNGTHHSILEVPGMKARTILVDSLSKRFSMTGWRLGFACTPAPIANRMAQLQEHVNSCACMFGQYAALTALENSPAYEAPIRDAFYERCLKMSGALNAIDKLSCPMPDGTFYLFVDIRGTGLDSESFALRLLEQEHIALVPGNAFNQAGQGYVRIACTLETPRLLRAAEGIKRFVESL